MGAPVLACFVAAVSSPDFFSEGGGTSVHGLFLLGRLKCQGAILDKSYAKFWGVNKVYCGRCINNDLQHA